jgi:hypothetical protein
LIFIENTFCCWPFHTHSDSTLTQLQWDAGAMLLYQRGPSDSAPGSSPPVEHVSEYKLKDVQG